MERTWPEDPWTLTPGDFPAAGGFAERARVLVAYATLAPSGHNTQPWLFAIGNGRIDVIADRRRALPVVDPADRELAISCGAALGTLEIAARRFGLRPDVALSPEPRNRDLLARVHLTPGAGPTAAETRLFDAVTARRTTRTAFAGVVPPDPLTGACGDHAVANGVAFDVYADAETRDEIARLVAEGDRLQFDDPDFRRELAQWVHSARLGSRDGVSASGFGMPDILSPAARLVIRTFDLGDGVAAADAAKITSGTPMLGLLSSPRDDQDSWTGTGRALAAILLELTAAGFTASYLNQPVETASLRPRLAEATGIDGHPQILIRIGRADAAPPPAVRRAVADVIV